MGEPDFSHPGLAIAPGRMLGRPREDEVRDLLPAVLPREVAATWVFLVLGGSRRLALLLEVGLVHRRRADAVFSTGGEQERRPRRVPVIDLRRCLRVEVGETGLEEGARRPPECSTGDRRHPTLPG